MTHSCMRHVCAREGIHSSFYDMWHDSFVYVTWLIHTCNVQSWWRVSIPILDTTHICDMFVRVRVFSLHGITTCDMTRSYKWHDTFIYEIYGRSSVSQFLYWKWRIHVCDGFVRVRAFNLYSITTCNLTHFYTWHDSFTHVMCSRGDVSQFLY